MDIATSALIRKRAEMSGEIEALRTKMARLQADLAHLDAVIRIMDPAAEPEAIRPKVPRNRCEWFGRGELFRLAMDALRTAPEPLSAMEIARAVVAGRLDGEALRGALVLELERGALGDDPAVVDDDDGVVDHDADGEHQAEHGEHVHTES